MDLFELVCVNMKRIRKEKGLSQEDVAQRMGIEQPNYSRLELGDSKPTLQTLVRLSEALGCGIEDLFFRPEQLSLMLMVKRIEALGAKKRSELVRLIDLTLTTGVVSETEVQRRLAELRSKRLK